MPKSGKRGRILDIISSKTNSAVRLLRELLREKKCRDEREMFVAEGDHLCGEIAALGGVELFIPRPCGKCSEARRKQL